MAQKVKVFTVKPEDPGLIPGNHKVEGDLTPPSCSLTSHVHPHTHTNKYINKCNKVFVFLKASHMTEISKLRT